jgi:hypothetical protein
MSDQTTIGEIAEDVGEGYPDLVVHLGNEKLIMELKAISGELVPQRSSNFATT